MEIFRTKSPLETFELGKTLAQRFSAGECVSLIGPLGAGKTALVRGIAAGMGIENPKLVSSPTFVLVQEYIGKTKIYHIDLYRLTSPQTELPAMGLDEMLADGLVIIEWADRAAGALPKPRWEITIEITGRKSRRFMVNRR